MWACATGAGLNGTVDDLVYGSAFSFIQPPEALANPDAKFHFVKWDVLLPDDAYRAAVGASGATVHPRRKATRPPSPAPWT